MSRTNTNNAAYSQNFLEVASQAGFGANEYVYRVGGDYKQIPDNALTTGSFGIDAFNLPTYSTNSSGAMGLWNNLGASRYNASAVLTNGNIVTVYQDTNSGTYYPVFKITTADNVIVVAQTTITSTYTLSYSKIGVIALSGGGFVAYWNNASGGTTLVPNYAVYSNTGAVVTSAFQDTSSGLTMNDQSQMAATALPNGGFVATFNTSTGGVAYRIYGATGTALYPWVNFTAASASVMMGIAARSDSSFCLAFHTSNTNVSYTVISATNSTIVALSNISIASAGLYVCSVGVLTNDTFVIGYIASSTPKFRLLPTGNALGSEIAIPFPSLTFAGSSTANLSVKGLSGGNFLYVAMDNFNIINYAFYSSTGTVQAAFQQVFGLYNAASGNSRSKATMTIVDLPSTAMVVLYNGEPSSFESLSQPFFVVDKTTYAVIGRGTNISATVATQSAPLLGYAKNASSPNKAYFYAAANQTLTSTVTQQSTAVTPITVSSLASTATTLCALPNGAGFAYGYVTQSSPKMLVSIYDVQGVLQSSFDPGIQVDTNSFNNIRITTLTNGNLIVAGLWNGNTTLYIRQYTVTGTLINSLNISGVQGGSSYNFGLCSISNNRFAISFANSSNAQGTFRVYNALTMSQLWQTTIPSGNSYAMALASTFNGNGFWAAWYSPDYGANQAYYFRESSTNTFGSGGLYSSFPLNNTQWNYQIAANSCNNVILPISDNGGNTYASMMSATASTSSLINVNCSGQGGTGSSGKQACCATALGAFAFFVVQNGISNTTNTGAYLNIMNAGENTKNTTSFTGITTASTESIVSASTCSLYGGWVVLSWINNALLPQFAIVSTTQGTYSKALVAGSTVSLTSLSVNPSTGYTLSGISLNNCPAGSTGQLQINGLAKLNSSYNAAQPATAFDHTNLNSGGVKGSVLGLSVTLKGSI